MFAIDLQLKRAKAEKAAAAAAAAIEAREAEEAAAAAAARAEEARLKELAEVRLVLVSACDLRSRIGARSCSGGRLVASGCWASRGQAHVSLACSQGVRFGSLLPRSSASPQKPQLDAGCGPLDASGTCGGAGGDGRG